MKIIFIFIFICLFTITSSKKVDIPLQLDEPIQLIKPDASHKNLFLIEETVKLLESIQTPIAVVGSMFLLFMPNIGVSF